MNRSWLVVAMMVVGCGPQKPYRLVAQNVDYGASVLDVYAPKDATTSMPALVAIHGGGWSSGDKAWARGVARAYCPRGYVVVGINYRLAPEHRWPAQILDCQEALRWTRDNAQRYGVDPSRVGAIGESAGGHLAALLVLRGPDRARCAVTAAGEGDLTVLGREPIMGNERQILSTLLGPEPWAPELLADLSPCTWARRDAAVLVAHATGDQNVYYQQGVRLHEALRAAGADTRMITVKERMHSGTWSHPRVLAESAGWLHGLLGGRRRARYEDPLHANTPTDVGKLLDKYELR